MKKMVATFFALSVSVNAFGSLGDSATTSHPSLGYERPVVQSYIGEDPRILNSEIISLVRDMERELVADATSQAISDVNDHFGFAAKCTSFATDADMGAWGDAIINELSRSKPAHLLAGSSDLVASCPQYNHLTEAGRQAVWVMVLNAMAHLESSCRREVTATGPNGKLIGLLQLHRGSERSYAPNCRNGDAETIEGTFRCGISMLNVQMKNRQALFSRQSYWDVLRPQAKSQKYKKIQSALSKFSICR